MNKPKSILKYKSETNFNNVPIPTRTTSASWLSRLQSKLYSQNNGNNEEDKDGDNPLLIAKQDLKRVTFPIGNFIIEHPFCSDDSPRDESYEKKKKELLEQQQKDRKLEVADLSGHYEHACIQREEGCIDRFRNILKANRTSQLQSIDLSRQPIAIHQAGPLSDVLILKFGLKYLDLSNTKLDDKTVRILLCSLLVSNTIQHLNLSQNSFKSKGFKYIAIFIKESKTIQSVDLSRCTIEKKGMQYLSQGLQHAKSLSKLTLDNCNIKPPAESFEIFSEGIYNSRSLKTLSLRNNRFSPPQSTWIANLIALNEDNPHGIKELDLSENNLGAMIAPLASVLRNNTTLLHLNLSNCNISHEGLSVLSNSLAENSCLETLDLSKNPLGGGDTDESILALKTALTRNSTLQSLNLSETLLDSSTAITLAEALPENASLARLDLSKNPNIEMAGILALAISIKMNHTLTFLDINIPPLDEELANLQNDIVAVCTTNMLQKVEAQEQESTQKQDSIIESNTTLSPSTSSSSSITTSNNSSLDNVVELPTREGIMAAKEALDGPESPQLNLVLEHGLEAAPAPAPTTDTNATAASTTL